jgi:L-gulonate 5-dehydrogenase
MMRAAIFDAPLALRLADAPRPSPGPGEALVRVGAAGLCAGDLYIYLGRNPYVTYPRIGGHEIAGTVEQLGPGTAGPPLGSRVVIEPFIGCGRCYPCRVGKSNCCADLTIIGVHREGGFADFVVAPLDHLHPIPGGLSMHDASFAEPLAIGVQACRRAQVTADDTVLVLGAGPIGLALVEVARAYGANVFATDIAAKRLETAAWLGATPLPPEDLVTRVLDATNGEGMPVVIEATGVPAVMTQALDLVAACGRVVIVGLARRGDGVTFPGLDITRKEATILGSRASVNCFPEALRLLASGAIRYTTVATAMPLSEAPATFDLLARDHGALHKAVFVAKEFA